MSGTCEIYHVYITMTKEKRTSCFNHIRTKRDWIKIIATTCNLIGPDLQPLTAVVVVQNGDKDRLFNLGRS